MIVWIIGLSGSGKSTLAKEVVKKMRIKDKSIIHLDGDLIRELYENDIGHTMEDRKINANRICKLCKFLDDQNIDVVTSILSIFPESRKWCRENLSRYYEVFIKTNINILKERDSKGIYKKYDQGILKNVAGIDIKFIEPESPDLIINNNGNLKELLYKSEDIVQQFLK